MSIRVSNIKDGFIFVSDVGLQYEEQFEHIFAQERALSVTLYSFQQQ